MTAEKYVYMLTCACNICLGVHTMHHCHHNTCSQYPVVTTTCQHVVISVMCGVRVYVHTYVCICKWRLVALCTVKHTSDV